LRDFYRDTDGPEIQATKSGPSMAETQRAK